MSNENKYVLSNVIEKFGEDDFTLWTVELRESDLKAALKDFVRVSGDPEQLLTNLPTISLSAPQTVLNLIFSNSKNAEIISAEVNTEFFARYRNEGCSVHGSLQDIICELENAENHISNFVEDNNMNSERGKVEYYRQQYPKGANVELISMDDPFRDMPAGLKGIVTLVDDACQVHCVWENGSSLALIPGVDCFRMIKEQEATAESDFIEAQEADNNNDEGDFER